MKPPQPPPIEKLSLPVIPPSETLTPSPRPARPPCVAPHLSCLYRLNGECCHAMFGGVVCPGAVPVVGT